MIVRDDDETMSILHGEPTSQSSPTPSLALPLRGVFFLNGVILALPTTALLYMVNIHVQIPVSWIPSYISLSFLPYSLKPIYAYISSILSIHLDVQITALLICSGLFYIVTAFIPSHAIVFFFTLGFMRSITTAWPDLLFDLVLIEDATLLSSLRSVDGSDVEELVEATSYAVIAAMFQSQAATDRSLGCIVAHVLVLLLLAFGAREGNAMNAQTFQFIFIVAGFCNFVSALVAWRYGIGRAMSPPASVPNGFMQPPISGALYTADSVLQPVRTPSYDSFESSPREESNGSALEIDSAKQPLLLNIEPLDERPVDDSDTDHDNASSSNSTVWLVVLLQTWIVLLTLRQPIVQATASIWLWSGIAVVSFMAFLVAARPLLVSIWRWKKNESLTSSFSTHQLRVGIFLILRYAVPSISYLMSSYIYTVFQEFPFLLQLLSLLDMLITTVSCWVYSKYLSRYSSGNQLWWLIGITTALAGITSFGNVFLIRVLGPEKHSYSMITKVLCTIGINAVMGFFNEWKFLPDVVLATVSIETMQNPSRRRPENQSSVDPNDMLSHTTELGLQEAASSNTIGLQYGSLMSCIDFGGQIGALVAGPLVAWLGTTRENNWQHLELLQEINSTMILCSIALLFVVAR